MAEYTAWTGVFMALDLLHPKMSKGRKSVDRYREVLCKRDSSILSIYNSTYETLHLVMGHDGNTDSKTKKAAWVNAKRLIEWSKANDPKDNDDTNGLSGTKKTVAKTKAAAKPKAKPATATKKSKKQATLTTS